MLQLVFLLLIAPAIIGTFIKSLVKCSNSVYSAFFFSLGFLIMVAEFALMCYPAIYLDAPFHRVCQLVCSIYIIECAAILIWLFFRQTNQQKKKEREQGSNCNLDNITCILGYAVYMWLSNHSFVLF